MSDYKLLDIQGDMVAMENTKKQIEKILNNDKTLDEFLEKTTNLNNAMKLDMKDYKKKNKRKKCISEHTRSSLMNCSIKINTDIWQHIDLIHEQNCSTGDIRLNVSPDFKEAILLAINEDEKFRDKLRSALNVKCLPMSEWNSAHQ